MLKIRLWKKDSGNMLSHGNGLRDEDVAALQKLKPGDRLILWENNDGSVTLKQFIKKETSDTNNGGGFKPV